MTANWYQQPCKPIDGDLLKQARDHQAKLTKPAGSLGMLEELAVNFCGWQDTLRPHCDNIGICVFAADHGVCDQGVSAFPQAVTAQMVHNFIAGGAAISVLAKHLKADFRVVNIGVKEPLADAVKLVNSPVMPGTHDFTHTDAMSKVEMHHALDLGRAQLMNSSAQLFIGGDMGIGNTTSASAIYSLMLDLSPQVTVGPGTGIDSQGIERKQRAVQLALDLHRDKACSGLETLQTVGGLEIAALVGAYIASAQNGIPILVDGFIASAAALLAVEINPSSRAWMMFAHRSAEPAHQHALDALAATPILDIGMRLGEGSGSAVAVPLIISALNLHNQMATFDGANVSEA